MLALQRLTVWIMATLVIRNLDDHVVRRQRVADRLAEFRRRTGARGSPCVAQLLEEARTKRTRTLARPDKAG